ncbi:hypothetical protein JS756_14195 [Streptomyces actuosus]|uniref:Tyr recombinase domain-containing protein n=1 Tax=Streptomyces actuosus TaxID=1885 RepID=A0ABS2VQG0_STRAS|nr:hypothetical protein [Streptomyces actuosus]MBN0045240.1 hypothetical protein [Streptomyces actuosus]
MRQRHVADGLLDTSDALGDELSRNREHSGQASVTRVATTDAGTFVIVDGSVPCVPAHGPAGVRRPAVVRVLESLFAGAWTAAVPSADRNRLRHRTRSGMTPGVLRRLGARLADDAGGRGTSVSLHTYRRHVAQVIVALKMDARAVALDPTPGHR